MPPRPLTPIARKLRRNQTDAETRLWTHLRARQLEGAKFVRQFPIGRYITDFACREHMLVIELDGGQHAENPADEARTRTIEAQGWRVMRFWNNDVLSNTGGVLQMIALELQTQGVKAPHPNPLPGGERE